MKLSAHFFLWVLPLASLDPNQGSLGPTVVGASNCCQAKERVLRRSLREMTKLNSTQQNEDLCSSMCLPGFYKKRNCTGKYLCSPCPEGTFTSVPNYTNKCRLCTKCDEGASMVTQTSCTPTSDTVCGCKEGYQQMVFHEKSFRCIKEKKPHETTVSLTTTTQVLHSTTSLPQHSVVPVLFASLALMLLGLLITAALYFRDCFSGGICCSCLGLRAKHTKPIYSTIIRTEEVPNCTSLEMSCDRRSDPESVVTSFSKISQCQPVVQKVSEVSTILNRPPCIDSALLSTADIKPADLKMLKQDFQGEHFPPPMLYAIIREVPVRRWKEFLRLLRVPDSQIERAELEVGPSYLEQQYQMLRLWSLRGGADLADIYTALGSMELSGCAQDLRDKLQQLEGVQPCLQMLQTESSERFASG